MVNLQWRKCASAMRGARKVVESPRMALAGCGTSQADGGDAEKPNSAGRSVGRWGEKVGGPEGIGSRTWQKRFLPTFPMSYSMLRGFFFFIIHLM